MFITVELVKSLNPCYDTEKLTSLIGEGFDITESHIELALSLPRADCRWILSRLLSRSNRIVWANGSADRAKKYAAACTATAASAAADAAAAYAAYAAADAAAGAAYAAYAAADAAADAEHRLAVEHAIKLLMTQE